MIIIVMKSILLNELNEYITGSKNPKAIANIKSFVFKNATTEDINSILGKPGTTFTQKLYNFIFDKKGYALLYLFDYRPPDRAPYRLFRGLQLNRYGLFSFVDYHTYKDGR